MKVKELKEFLSKIPDEKEIFDGAGIEELKIDFFNSVYNSLEVIDYHYDGVNVIIQLKKRNKFI